MRPLRWLGSDNAHEWNEHTQRIQHPSWGEHQASRSSPTVRITRNRPGMVSGITGRTMSGKSSVEPEPGPRAEATAGGGHGPARAPPGGTDGAQSIRPPAALGGRGDPRPFVVLFEPQRS